MARALIWDLTVRSGLKSQPQRQAATTDSRAILMTAMMIFWVRVRGRRKNVRDLVRWILALETLLRWCAVDLDVL